MTQSIVETRLFMGENLADGSWRESTERGLKAQGGRACAQEVCVVCLPELINSRDSVEDGVIDTHECPPAVLEGGINTSFCAFREHKL